jgi:hypothetical protein
MWNSSLRLSGVASNRPPTKTDRALTTNLPKKAVYTNSQIALQVSGWWNSVAIGRRSAVPDHASLISNDDAVGPRSA